MKRLMRFLAVATLSAMGAVSSAADLGRIKASATPICERAASPAYVLDPADADACWTALEAAVRIDEYDHALRMARLGCEKHGRADFCTFLGNLRPPLAEATITRTSGGRNSLARSFFRALDLVTPIDVEDADIAVYRALSRRNPAK